MFTSVCGVRHRLLAAAWRPQRTPLRTCTRRGGHSRHL